ncbi:hypothetical protein Psch_00524 [Pelotomaculum schinkii]|uniref:Uncharacterized protein n=1 Tax=Pelotomaculum schinkii TaxID=78350 RepID=A0A4Y7RDV8_9FIRM|nr:hypothetical protein Psch_00524 [Pelotomaculum schinkii]
MLPPLDYLIFPYPIYTSLVLIEVILQGYLPTKLCYQFSFWACWGMSHRHAGYPA